MKLRAEIGHPLQVFNPWEPFAHTFLKLSFPFCMIIHTSLLTSADFLHVSLLNPKTTLINVIKMLNVHFNSLVFKRFDDRDNLTRSHSDETSLNIKKRK